ncbi:MAG: hypothetical protein ACP5UA_04965 [Candidatus Hydrogenedens sp.]
MWEKRFTILFVFIGFCFFSLSSNAVEVVIPSVSVNTGECFAININLYRVEDEDIRTSVIAFAFDPLKIQIGCNNSLNSDTNGEPWVYDSETSDGEQPIVLNNSLLSIGIKYRVAIYPQGVMIVVLWDASEAIPAGTLFTVPCKLKDGAISGDKLNTLLISKDSPIYIMRTFPDNHVENLTFYCSFADINALPVNSTLISGYVYVKNATDGEPEGGEGYLEGGFEGTSIEGTTEGSIVEGITEGTSSEGIPEGNSTEGERPICGCRERYSPEQRNMMSFLQILKLNNMNIGFMIALVVILRRL